MIITAEEFSKGEVYWAIAELHNTICQGLESLFKNFGGSYLEDGVFEFYKIDNSIGCKIYYRELLIREFVDNNPLVICYFEDSFPIHSEELKFIHEALKEILTKDGIEPEESFVERELLYALSAEITKEIDKEIVASINKQTEYINSIAKKVNKSTTILTAETCEDIVRLMKTMGIKHDY